MSYSKMEKVEWIHLIIAIESFIRNKPYNNPSREYTILYNYSNKRQVLLEY